MNKIIITIGIIVLVIVLILLLKPKKKTEINNIKSMSINYTTGTYIYADILYEIECSDKCIARFKPNGVSYEEKNEKDIDKNTIKKIENVLNKYDVIKWNGFNQNDKNVLDGNSFSVNIKYNDNKTIEAHGYMMYPKNYRDVLKEIKEIFNEIFGE
jgi:hypothetical protein